MNFQELQARYRRLFNEDAAWKLLRADNAPLILAYIKGLFAEQREIPYGQARVILDAELNRCRDLGTWETETNAGTYLNHWIKAGWLREMDDMLMQTDASETALRFCHGLVERMTNTSASHLRIVQEAVRDFAAASNPNTKERIELLESKKNEIQQEINKLKRGEVKTLSEVEQRERLLEIYQLAAVLTGDFRRVEDEIRRLDKDFRIKIIEEGASRGEVLSSLMQKEQLLAATEAGSAFDSFFNLLCDNNRSDEFREQLRAILNRPIARFLRPQQQKFLGHLMRELAHESTRVQHIRRRTEESLRAYIESGNAQENRTVDLLLHKLGKTAIALRETTCDLKAMTSLTLNVGTIKVNSPENMRLHAIEDRVDTSNTLENTNSREPSEHILRCLDVVQIKEIAHKIFITLKENGPMTIAKLAMRNRLTAGLEELVAYLRVAKSVNATTLQEKESIDIEDSNGLVLRATIPKVLLSAELFPESINELIL